MLRISYKTIHAALFMLGIVLICLLFDVGKIAEYGPVSLHRWRQADCASLARCYYENGMHFFQPKVHHMIGGDNAAVSEFPIMYYAAAALYHLWGPDDTILRWLDFLVLIFGLYAVSRLLLDLYGNWLFSFSGGFLLLGSPIVAFYGFNYMPNTVGVGFVLMGMYAYYRWVNRPGRTWMVMATLLFTLGGLIKVTTLIPFLATLATAGFFLLFDRKNNRTWRDYFPPLPRLFTSAAIVLGVTAGWYLWASHYNASHNSWLLTTSFRAIWDIDTEAVRQTYREIVRAYHDLYFHPRALVVFLILIPVVLACCRFIARPVYVFYVFMLLGTIAFLILFYGQILVHHYYIIDIIPFLLLTFLLLPLIIRRLKPGWFRSWWFQLLFFAFTVFSVNYGRENMLKYYNDQWRAPAAVPPSFFKQEALRGFLKEHDISYENDLVQVAPDVTPNHSLYYYNLRGWSEFPDSELSRSDVLTSISNGAEYLIISDTSYLSKPELQEFYQSPVGIFDGAIYFFELR